MIRFLALGYDFKKKVDYPKSILIYPFEVKKRNDGAHMPGSGSLNPYNLLLEVLDQHFHKLIPVSENNPEGHSHGPAQQCQRGRSFSERLTLQFFTSFLFPHDLAHEFESLLQNFISTPCNDVKNASQGKTRVLAYDLSCFYYVRRII